MEQFYINWLTSTHKCSLVFFLYNLFYITENLSTNYQTFAEDVWETFGTDYDFNYPENIPSSAAHYFSEYEPKYDSEDFYIAKPPVTCKPMPGKYMSLHC